MNARRARGYTLIELVVVVGIIGLIAMIAVPQTSSNEPHRLAIAASEFANAMRFARSEALRTRTPHGFTLFDDNKTLQVFQLASDGFLEKPIYDVRHPVTKQLYHISIDKHAFAEVGAVAVSAKYRGACSSMDSVQFDENGTPRCQASSKVTLVSLIVDLKLGAEQNSLTLDGLTGRVSVQ